MEGIAIPAIAYLLVGLAFAIAFVVKGCGVLDTGARSSSIGFRIMIFPASILLWPYLAVRWRGDTR